MFGALPQMLTMPRTGSLAPLNITRNFDTFLPSSINVLLLRGSLTGREQVSQQQSFMNEMDEG